MSSISVPNRLFDESLSDLSVSVVIPTHNRAHLIVRAVASALAAIDVEDEVIVVDDGSTDGTEAVLAPLRDRIRYGRINGAGAGAARNAGIEQATKPLIAFLDSDDEWLPFKLKLQKAVLAKHPELVFSCSNFSVRTPAGDSPSYLERWWGPGRSLEQIFGNGVPFPSPVELLSGPRTCPLHIADLYESIMRDGVACLITLVYRRSRGPDLRFPEDLPTYEDWEFTARLSKLGPAGYLDCDTAINYGHGGPRLTDANAVTCAATRLKVMPRVWGNDPEFMASHHVEYGEVWSEQSLRAANWLIRHGRGREAGSFLTGIPDVPLATRIGARLPIPTSAATLLRQGIQALRRRRQTKTELQDSR